MGIFIYFQNITKSQKVNLKIQQVPEVVERTCTSLLFHFKPQRREESLWKLPWTLYHRIYWAYIINNNIISLFYVISSSRHVRCYKTEHTKTSSLPYYFFYQILMNATLPPPPQPTHYNFCVHGTRTQHLVERKTKFPANIIPAAASSCYI